MIRVARRLVPTRVAAQLAVVVVVSLLLIHLIVTLSFHFLRETRGVDDRVHIAPLVSLVAAQPAGDDRARMVAEIGRTFPDLHAHLTRTPPPSVEPGPSDAFGPSESLAGRFGARWRVVPVAPSAPGAMPTHTIAIGFEDGEWLVLDDPIRQPPPFPGPFVVSTIFGVVCAGLLGLWAARNLVRPLRDLATAARDFDIEGEPHPLVEGGPDEVRIASRAFVAMRDRIRILVEDRTGMLAAMGHDLRTPITRLRLRAEFLTDEVLRQEFLRDLVAMNDMIEGALTYLREGRHEEKVGLVDLSAMLETICDQFGDLGHDVTYAGPDHLVRRVRPHALTRALTNLVDNATKFGTRVAVRLAVVDADVCRIEVEDDGPGIPIEARDAMLRPFARGDVARNMNDGSGFGLGLAIVRAVVDGHAGRLTLADGASGGLRVVVDLPAVPDPAHPSR